MEEKNVNSYRQFCIIQTSEPSLNVTDKSSMFSCLLNFTLNSRDAIRRGEFRTDRFYFDAFLSLYVQFVPKMWKYPLIENSWTNFFNIFLHKNFRYVFFNKVINKKTLTNHEARNHCRAMISGYVQLTEHDKSKQCASKKVYCILQFVHCS